MAGGQADLIGLLLNHRAILPAGDAVKKKLILNPDPVAGALLPAGRIELLPPFLQMIAAKEGGGLFCPSGAGKGPQDGFAFVNVDALDVAQRYLQPQGGKGDRGSGKSGRDREQAVFNQDFGGQRIGGVGGEYRVGIKQSALLQQESFTGQRCGLSGPGQGEGDLLQWPGGAEEKGGIQGGGLCAGGRQQSQIPGADCRRGWRDAAARKQGGRQKKTQKFNNQNRPPPLCF